jgi:hypothetical protein
MTLEELATGLRQAIGILAPAHGQLPEDVSDETVFALGEMLGAALRARESIRRDIQCQSLSVSNAEPSTSPRKTESSS